MKNIWNKIAIAVLCLVLGFATVQLFAEPQAQRQVSIVIELSYTYNGDSEVDTDRPITDATYVIYRYGVEIARIRTGYITTEIADGEIAAVDEDDAPPAGGLTWAHFESYVASSTDAYSMRIAAMPGFEFYDGILPIVFDSEQGAGMQARVTNSNFSDAGKMVPTPTGIVPIMMPSVAVPQVGAIPTPPQVLAAASAPNGVLVMLDGHFVASNVPAIVIDRNNILISSTRVAEVLGVELAGVRDDGFVSLNAISSTRGYVVGWVPIMETVTISRLQTVAPLARPTLQPMTEVVTTTQQALTLSSVSPLAPTDSGRLRDGVYHDQFGMFTVTNAIGYEAGTGLDAESITVVYLGSPATMTYILHSDAQYFPAASRHIQPERVYIPSHLTVQDALAFLGDLGRADRSVDWQYILMDSNENNTAVPFATGGLFDMNDLEPETSFVLREGLYITRLGGEIYFFVVN